MRVLRRFLGHADAAGGFEPLVALVRSAPGDDQSAALLREYMQHQIAVQLIAHGITDAELRVGLFGSTLIGLAATRYLVPTEPVASADPETLITWLGPVLQGYLTGPRPPGDDATS